MNSISYKQRPYIVWERTKICSNLQTDLKNHSQEVLQMATATFRSVRLDSVPGASTTEIGWNCNELLFIPLSGLENIKP